MVDIKIKLCFSFGLIILGGIDLGIFYLGYYVTDKIDVNTAIQNAREAIEEEAIDTLMEQFGLEENEDWERIENLLSAYEKDQDENEELMCYGLKIRIQFIPPEIKNIKSSIFLLFKALKFDKINANAKSIQFTNFIDGACISGLAIIAGICALFSGIWETFNKILKIFIMIIIIIVIIEVVACNIAKLVFQIKQWIYYKGSRIKFSVKVIKKCDLKKIFKEYYKFLFNIKDYIIGNLFTSLFNCFIYLTVMLSGYSIKLYE